MTDTTSTLDRRCRTVHPAEIDIGTDILVRDDIVARKYGVTTRTLGRGDAHGAPYTYIGGVKYRPGTAYAEFVKGRIQVRVRGARQQAARLSRRDQRARVEA